MPPTALAPSTRVKIGEYSGFREDFVHDRGFDQIP